MNKGYQKVIDRLIEAMSKGVIPWRRPWSTPKNAISGKQYRGINYLMLATSNFTDPRYLTFLQAQDLGGHIKQGALGFPIVKWIIPSDEDKERNPNARPWVKCYTVFSVEQCEGLVKLPELVSVECNPLVEAQSIIYKWANKPQIIFGGYQAGYSPKQDRVIMPEMEKFSSPEAFYDTFFHELIHSTGHENRLDRGLSPQFDVEKYAVEELTAEIGSAMLCSEAHIDNSNLTENNAAYLHSWLKAVKNDPNMIVKAASLAARAVEFILGGTQLREEVEPETEEVMQVA